MKTNICEVNGNMNTREASLETSSDWGLIRFNTHVDVVFVPVLPHSLPNPFIL